MYFSVLKQLILREPDPAQSRVYVLIIITGEREFKSRRKDSLGTYINLAQAAAGSFYFETSLLYRYFSGK